VRFLQTTEAAADVEASQKRRESSFFILGVLNPALMGSSPTCGVRASRRKIHFPKYTMKYEVIHKMKKQKRSRRPGLWLEDQALRPLNGPGLKSYLQLSGIDACIDQWETTRK
jgi:hypothetical protein